MGVWQWTKARLELVDPLKQLPQSEQDDLESKKQHAKLELGRASADAVEVLTASWQRDYDEVRSDWDSVQSRSAQLLLAVGIISGLAGIATPFLSRSIRIPPAIVVLAVVIALALGFVACFTAIQVIRVQGVGFWTTTDLKPKDGWQKKQYQVEYAYQLFRASRENWLRLSALVDRLRSAQRSALASLVLLVTIIVMNLLVSATAEPASVPPTKIIIVSPSPTH